MSKTKSTKKPKSKSTRPTQPTFGLTRAQIRYLVKEYRLPSVSMDQCGGKTEQVAVVEIGLLCERSMVDLAHVKYRTSPVQAEIDLAYAVFERFEGYEPTQRVNSYLLKHLVERSMTCTYISNGAAIVAAAQAGFRQKTDVYGSINSTVYVPVELLRSLGQHTQRKPGARLPVVVVWPDGSTLVKDSSAPQLQTTQPG